MKYLEDETQSLAYLQVLLLVELLKELRNQRVPISIPTVFLSDDGPAIVPGGPHDPNTANQNWLQNDVQQTQLGV